MSKAWNKTLGRTNDAKWRAIRFQVMTDNVAINNGRCVLRIDGVCTYYATEVHHTRSRAIVGDDPRYLVAVCKWCNLAVGEPEKHSPPIVTHTKW